VNLKAPLLLAAFLLCGGPSVAQETVALDDATLRAAYCIPIVQWGVDLDKEVDAEYRSKSETTQSAQERAQLSHLRETLRKLTEVEEAWLSRLKARMPSAVQSEPAALAEATKRGETDRERFRAEAKQCTDTCVSSTPHVGPKPLACLRSCSDPELHARIKACEVMASSNGWGVL